MFFIIHKKNQLGDAIDKVSDKVEKKVEDFRLGDLREDALKSLTGKDTYEFGDLTHSAIKAFAKDVVKDDVQVGEGRGGEEKARCGGGGRSIFGRKGTERKLEGKGTFLST